MDPETLDLARSLFYRALDIHREGNAAEAERLYLQALSLAPNRGSVLTNLASVLIQQKKYHGAISHIEKALELDAEDPIAWLNKALYFHGIHGGRETGDALSCCARAIALDPGCAEAHCGRGIILMGTGRRDEALVSFDTALAIRPDYAEALSGRGRVLRRMGRHEEALASLDRALEIKPRYVEALQDRAELFRALGRHAEALDSFHAALEIGGNPENLRFFMASLGGADPPPVLPRDLLVDLFDGYAEGFEAHQAAMQYRAPEALFDAVAAGAPRAGWDIADLGCGTGLCGALFRPLARTLTGVDLSPNMVDKARSRNVYDEVVQAEVTEFLVARPRAFDLVIAADVFIYIGDLRPVFDAARAALRPGGWFAFSLETHEGAGFIVRASRRYAQSLPYLSECAADCGFVQAGVNPVVLRKEYGRDVDGVIVVLRPR